MKRFVSFLMVLTFIMLSTVEVFADNSLNQKVYYSRKPSFLKEQTISNTKALQIEEEINKLNQCHIDTSIINRVNVRKSGNEYNLHYGNVDERVTVECDGNKNVIISSSDGKKSNTIIFNKDGSIILDGYKVQITEVQQENTNINYFSTGKIWEGVKSLSPYGKLKSSDYKKYLSSKKQNISLGKALDQLTVTTLTSLIGLLNPYAGIAVSLAGVARNVYNVIVNINPKTKYIGCSYTTYTAGASDYKYVNKFYANSQCTGKYRTEISYEHFTVY